MRAEDLDLIERRLGVKLPPFYAAFVTSYPVLPREAADIAEYDVFDDPHRVIAANVLVCGSLPGLSWPERLLVIGESGCGDYYAIQLDGGSEAVHCWNHEIGDFEESADSLAKFLEGLIDAT